MNYFQIAFISSSDHRSDGTILKRRGDGKMYFLPAAIRKNRKNNRYIVYLFLLFILDYVLYIPLTALPNAIYIYPIATIIIPLIMMLLYIKMTYNYENIENDLIYIGNDTESLKNYFSNIFINEEIKFFEYSNKTIVTHYSSDYYHQIRKGIFINDIAISIGFNQISKTKFYMILISALLFFMPCFILLSYGAIILKGLIPIILLPLTGGMMAAIIASFCLIIKVSFKLQIEMINFLVDKYGKKENEK